MNERENTDMETLEKVANMDSLYKYKIETSGFFFLLHSDTIIENKNQNLISVTMKIIK